MRNVSNKNCRENQNTHFILSNFSRKSRYLWDNIEKYGAAREAADGNTAGRGLVRLYARKHTTVPLHPHPHTHTHTRARPHSHAHIHVNM